MRAARGVRTNTAVRLAARYRVEDATVSKYSIAKAAIARALAEATKAGLDHGEVVEALIVSAVQDSIRLRGAGPTKASLRYEEASISGEVDFDFIRSR